MKVLMAVVSDGDEEKASVPVADQDAADLWFTYWMLSYWDDELSALSRASLDKLKDLILKKDYDEAVSLVNEYHPTIMFRVREEEVLTTETVPPRGKFLEELPKDGVEISSERVVLRRGGEEVGRYMVVGGVVSTQVLEAVKAFYERA